MIRPSGCMTLKTTHFAQNGSVLSWAIWTNTFSNKTPRTEYLVENYIVDCGTCAGPVRILCVVLDLRLSLSTNSLQKIKTLAI